jgi:hypothetical protein
MVLDLINTAQKKRTQISRNIVERRRNPQDRLKDGRWLALSFQMA